MKHKSGLFLFAILFISPNFWLFAESKVPEMFNVQAVLRDVEGNVASGVYTVQFTLYEQETGGAPIWGPVAQTLTVTGGFLNTYLTISPEVFRQHPKLWLAINVGMEDLPRRPISASPYAFQAQFAEEAVTALNLDCIECIDDIHVASLDGDKIVDKSLSLSKLADAGCAAGETITWNGTEWVCGVGGGLWLQGDGFIRPKNNASIVITDDGAIGIGTTNPKAVLDVSSGGIKVGYDGSLCVPQIAGLIQWTGSHLQVCTGTDWRQLDNQASPEIVDVSPKIGPITGGTDIVISGTFFAPGAVVTIDDKQALGVSVTPPNKITAKTPPGDSTGWKTVKVINPDGQEAILQNGFAYKPTIDSITPNIGSAEGGLSITIKGSGFAPGAKVFIGPDETTNVVVQDSNTITCKTGKGTNSGPNDVKVKNQDGMEETKASAFTYQPWIDFLSPDFDYIAGGKKVIINGAGFGTGVTQIQLISTTPNMTINVSTFTQISPTQVEMTVPATTVTGYKNVKLVSAGNTITKTNGFRYIPSITSVNPSGIPFNDTTTNIVISGTGYNTSNTWVKFGDVTPIVVSRTTTSVTVRLPSGITATGWKDVTVTNNDSPLATSVTASGAIQLSPKITGFTPANGPVTGGTTVTISGAGFVSGPDFKVLMDNKEASGATVVNSTTITATSPSVSTAGQKPLKVINGDGTWYEVSSGFAFKPVVLGITPSEGFVSGGLDVTISGLGFANGSPATTVTIGNGSCTSVVVVNDKTITCKTPTSSSTGAKDVVVTVNGQSGTLPGAFAYIPQITNINPKSGTASGGYTITITGTGFVTGTTNGSQVLIGTSPCTNPNTSSTTTITCTVPASNTTGPRDVRVTNPDGTFYIYKNGFTYTPGITSVTQASTNALGGWDLTIVGAGFAPNTQVFFDNLNNDVTASVKSREGNTKIVLTMPQGFPAGKHDLIVKNPDDDTSFTKSQAFTLEPTLTGVSPDNGPADGSQEVLITGAGFSSSSTVPTGNTEIWIDNNSSYKCSEVTVISTTQLKCKPPKHANLLSGTHSLVVKVTTQSTTYTGLASINYGYNPTIIRWLVGGVEQNWGPVTGITSTYTIEGWGWPTSGIAVLIDGKPVKNLTRTGAGSGSTTPQTLTCIPDSSPSGTGWKPVTAMVTISNVDYQTLYQVPSPLPSPPPKQIFRYDPSATSFLPSPFEGPATGGTLVTVEGSGFVGTKSVTFGGLPGVGMEGTELTVTDTVIMVKTPGPFKSGPADVYINKSDGSFVKLSSPFVYRPVITNVSPAFGPADGSQVVTVTGAGFWVNASNPTVTTTIYIGSPGSSYTCQSVTDLTLTSLKCTPQKHATGLLAGPKTISARVTVGGINYDSITNGTYEYRPAIQSWSQQYSPITGSSGYTVYGWGMASSASSNKVQIKKADGTWNNVTCTGFSAGSGTTTPQSLSSCSIPAGDYTGWKDVKIIAGISGVDYATEYLVPPPPNSPLAQNFRYDPVISSVSPANGDATGGTLVTINGAGLHSQPDKITVEFGSGGTFTKADVQEVAGNGTYVKVLTPGPLIYGSKDIRITKDDGTTTTKSGAYIYNLKVTNIIVPTDILPGKNTIECGGGEDIEIIGGGFDPANNPTSLTIGGISCTVKSKALDKIVCTTGSITTVGPKDFYIRYGSSCSGSPYYNCVTLPGALIAQPTISQIWDQEGPRVGGESIKITGQGFVATTPYANYNEIYFGQKLGTITSVSGTTTYQVTTPPGDTTGWVPVKVRVKSGSTWYESDPIVEGYKYRDIPSVAGVSPASGSANGGEWIEVSGIGFVDGAQVQVGDEPSGKLWDCTDEMFDPVTGKIKAKTPVKTMEAGVWGIRVINPGDYSHWKGGIYTVHPAIDSVNPVDPKEGLASGGTVITVKGAGFTKGNNGGTTVQIGRLSPANLLTCTVVEIPSTTELKCTTPATGTSHAAGPKGIKITVGTTTPAQADNVFIYKPAITSFSKNTEIIDGGSSNITVSGAGFAYSSSIASGQQQ